MTNYHHCTRCDNPRKTMLIVVVSVGAHSLPSLGQPDFSKFEPPQLERVCGNCLTDREIWLQLSPVVEFCLSTLLKDKAENAKFPQIAAALETARTFFITRNNNPDGHNRQAAVKVLGLGDD